VQDVLNQHIQRLDPLKVDGLFGPKTEERVREFQRANTLQVDGIVGPKTGALLFEVTVLPVNLLLMPRLELTLPGSNPSRLQPPRLIPPLQFPGGLPAASPPVSLRLNPSLLVTLPDLGTPGNVLTFQLKIPSRNDPLDPNVRARQNLIELIDTLPVNSKFKAFLIGQVPNPVQKISAPGTGFKWGVEPLFNPLDPKGFGVKGNAAFTVRVTGGSSPSAPNVVVGAWGDGKVFLNFSTKRGEVRPKVEGEGTIFLGVKGTF
jgi:peptidoglycan hydrolase-like protein with peptidoglycan-binding domain